MFELLALGSIGLGWFAYFVVDIIADEIRGSENGAIYIY